MNVDQMTKELVIDEGVRLKPYRCTAGKLTIGIGRNLDDRGITMGEATILLANDIAVVTQDLDRALPWWTTLSEVRQRVMVNMAFNLGISRLLGFKNTLTLIKIAKYEDAAKEMLDSNWARQVGPRAIRLAKMMRDG
jgi:lysozyme